MRRAGSVSPRDDEPLVFYGNHSWSHEVITPGMLDRELRQAPRVLVDGQPRPAELVRPGKLRLTVSVGAETERGFGPPSP